MNLFAGQTLGQAYENYFDFNPNTVARTVQPDHPDLSMWVDKDNWNYWQYNNAFAGKSNQTLQDLFKPATLGGIPVKVTFTVNISEVITIQPTSQTVTPSNLSGQIPISWSLNMVGNWFSVSPMLGHTPMSFTIKPTTYDTTRPGRYTGVITVTASDPAATEKPVQSIALTLDVLAPELGGMPTAVDFFYSIPDHAFLAESYTLVPKNVGSADPLNWQVVTDSPWLHLTPPKGQTPQSFTLAATDFDTMTVATYSRSITLTATAPGPVYHSPQVLPVTLHVIDRSLSHVYLPLIWH